MIESLRDSMFASRRFRVFVTIKMTVLVSRSRHTGFASTLSFGSNPKPRLDTVSSKSQLGVEIRSARKRGVPAMILTSRNVYLQPCFRPLLNESRARNRNVPDSRYIYQAPTFRKDIYQAPTIRKETVCKSCIHDKKKSAGHQSGFVSLRYCRYLD